jgi:hypothetical protein
VSKVINWGSTGRKKSREDFCLLQASPGKKVHMIPSQQKKKKKERKENVGHGAI